MQPIQAEFYSPQMQADAPAETQLQTDAPAESQTSPLLSQQVFVQEDESNSPEYLIQSATSHSVSDFNPMEPLSRMEGLGEIIQSSEDQVPSLG